MTAAAKSGRGKGNKLPSRAAAARHAKVVALRSTGMAWHKVAAEVGLGESSCKEAWTKWVAEGKLAIQELDPIEVVMEQIARLDTAIGELAEIGADTKVQASARVGAIIGKAKLMAQQTELLQAVGLMPKRLGKLSVELEMRWVSQQLFVILEQYVPGDRLAEAEGQFASLLSRNGTALEAG